MSDLSSRILVPLTTGSGSGSPVVIPNPVVLGSYGGASGPRFYQSPPWRTVVTNLETETLTFLDHLASGRVGTYTLDAAATFAGRVPSDSPEVNILADEDAPALPFVAEGRRLLYCFRRENDVWVIRFSGIILGLEDTAGSDDPATQYTAHDPWTYWNARPIRTAEGELPGQDGVAYTATPGNEILIDLLNNARALDGDLLVDWDSTFFGGTLETTEEIDITFQQGLSLGEAVTQLTQTGSLDVILTPIYDPFNRPGVCCDLNVYASTPADPAGEQRDSAVFAWDKPSRSLVGVSRLYDGNQRANSIQYYAGQGGPPVTLQEDAASIALYRAYWSQQFWPGQVVEAAVEAFAQAQLRLRKEGKTTYTFDPVPERSPAPFLEYYLGDTVPVYASDRLRAPIAEYQRIYGFTVDIDDNAMETVRNLLTSPPDLE